MEKRRQPRPRSRKLRVVVADPDPIARTTVIAALQRDPHVEVVGEAQDVITAGDTAEATRPDIVVIAEWFPGPLSGIDGARDIRQRAPEASVLMLVLPNHDHDLLAGVKAGVRGYITKRTDMRDLADSLRRAAAPGVSPLSADLSEELLAEVQEMANAGRDALTDREQEVLALVRRGLSNREIAEAMSISVATVKTHVHSLLRKMGCSRRVQLVMLDRPPRESG